MWKAAVLVSIGLPLVFLTVCSTRWLLLLRAASSVQLSLWPQTSLEAKEFLSEIGQIVFRQHFNPDLGPLEQNLAYLEAVKKGDWAFSSFPYRTDPLLKWRVQYLQSKLREGHFTRRIDPPYGQFEDYLPQLICEMEVPPLSRRAETLLRIDIIRFKQTKNKISDIPSPQNIILTYFNLVSLLLYLVARLSIIAIAFSCFRAMPSSVYVATWTKYIPTIE